jgi:hypothetical protein
MGKWHAHTVSQIGATVGSVIDNNTETGLKLARQYGAQFFPDAEQFFETDSCDVVHICTPLETHFHLANRALDTGKHVLVEKPLTGTESEAIQLSRRAQELGRSLCPVHQFAFQRGVGKLQSILQKRSAPPLSIEFDIASAGGEDYPKDKLNSLILEILPHPLSVLYRLWPLEGPDEPEWQITWPRNGDLIAQCSHRGIPVLIRISLHARPTRCSMLVQHQEGAIEQNFFHGHAVFDSPRVSRLSKIAGPFAHSGKVVSAATINLVVRAIHRQWAYPGLENLVRQFYACIGSGGTEVPIEAEDYIAVARACDRFRGHQPNA